MAGSVTIHSIEVLIMSNLGDLHIFEIVDNDGYFYFSVDSAPTHLTPDEYFNKHIRDILPALAVSHNVEKLLWDTRPFYRTTS
jgi:hypothetical protein